MAPPTAAGSPPGAPARGSEHAGHGPAVSRPPGAPRSGRRQQILVAAARLFRERGYHGTSIDELGTAVGISGPALYRHFPSKEAVLAALAEAGISELAALVEAEADVAAAAPARDEARDGARDDAREAADALARALRALLHRARRDRDLAAVVLREARHLGPDLALPSRRARQRLDRGLVTLVGRARPDLGREEVEMLVGALYGLVGLPVSLRTKLGDRQLEDVLVDAGLHAVGVVLPEGGVVPRDGAATGPDR